MKTVIKTMRNRTEIEESIKKNINIETGYQAILMFQMKAQLELLFDIRDLLSKETKE